MDRGAASRFRRVVREVVAAAADFLLPIACVTCERPLDDGERGIVCGRCWARLALLHYPRCVRCGHPSGRWSCRWCDLLPPYVRAVRSVCWVPEGVGGKIVHALKYDGWRRVADGMAERILRLPWPEDVVIERSFIAPVPLAQSRLRERGYNQSALLARALSRGWGIPVVDSLSRTRETESQTRLTPGDRLRNVAGAFVAVVPKPVLAGCHVVLVDDVVTTAATLNSCAAALYQGGARIISYVTFGRARAAGDRL